VAPAGLGLGTIVQLLPFQDSISGCPTPSFPVAMQLVELVQETLPSELTAPTLGLGTIDHADPFQDSISVCDVSEEGW
jgi:hypothetical protein